MSISNGAILWNKAKKMIPDRTQLLSKQSEMFLPGKWPSYFSQAKGINVWGLDGTQYKDMSLMGVGSCILGYSDEDVDSAVIKTINAGTMSTLNSVEEVELAELLLSKHSWAGKVRYARTGGEAMAMAARIARASSRKDKIAFCGYHGWHDWYLASNLANDRNLDGHLLPGLNPLGVPRGLIGSSIPFNYNCIDELETIVSEQDIGTIIMEPVRDNEPKDDFLKKVKKIADDINAILVFDEVSSGWRLNKGGAYELFDVIPDIIVYAKAMSNGYPMAAIIGVDEVMDVAQDTFISSTYCTERIGPTSAIATINKIIDNDVPDHIHRVGSKICTGWKQLAVENGLEITIYDYVPSLAHFEFNHPNKMALQTLFTQEMLKKGYLAWKKVYVSYGHSMEHTEIYLEDVDRVFTFLAKAINSNDLDGYLDGDIAQSGFKRLT